MLKTVSKRFACFVLVLLMLFSLFPVMQAEATYSGSITVEGLTAGAGDGDNGTWQGSGTTITGSATTTSSTSCGNTTYNAKTGNLTLTNSSGEARVLTFDYALELNGGSASVDGAAVTANGSFSKKLESGESVAISLTSSGSAANTAKITLSNLALEAEKAVTVTFAAPEHGSYTVDGTAITASTPIEKMSSEKFALAATAASGYKFYCWYSNTDNAILSMKASDSLSFNKDQEVVAKFVPSSTPFFGVGTATFIDLNEAINYAVANNQPKIALLSNGTLPAGEYTIPSGKTLVIPFDNDQTVYTSTPAVVYAARVTPSAFRTLTMASGAKITVANGAVLSVPSKLCANGTNSGSVNGTPTGPHGRIAMNAGSSIDVQSGGTLAAYGYISGSGNVYARSGATVWEAFQIRCWRGGTATSNMAGNSQKVFPLNQYYVQNIEAPITYYPGATEKVYTAVNMSSKAFVASATFIGSGGMFSIDSGSATKRFTGATDRLELTVEGNFSITPMSLRITGLPIIGTIDLNTADYVLPIQSNITINANSGTTTVSQDVAFLPGSELNIADGATVKIASGHKAYVYDKDQWGAYAAAGLQLVPVGYSTVNGTTAKRTEASLVDAKIDVNGTLDVAGALYTTQSGAAIVSSGGTGKVVLTAKPGTETKTYMATQSGSDITYVDIPITAAQLQHVDGTYYQTARKAAGTTIPNAAGWWDHQPVTFTVSFDANGGEGTMEPQTFTEGQEGTLSANTFTKTGYHFTGWNTAPDGSGASIPDKFSGTIPGASDMTLYAQWEINTYTVKWLDADGEILETDNNVPYGTTPEYNGVTPTKAATESQTFSFSGWDPEVTAVTGDVSYTAQFTEAARTYTVTWKDEDGNVLETDEMPYGEMPVYNNGEPPVKAADQQYTYTFKAWSPEVVAVSGDATYTATYDKTVNTYTVTWLAEDGKTVLDTNEVAYGSKPVYNDGVDPVKDDTAQFDYEFAGWVNGSNTYAAADLPVVTDNVAYKASFTETLRTYTVTWVNDDGSVLETDEKVPYGSAPSYDGATPTKAATAEFTYTFDKWTPEVADVTGDVTYKATYTETINTYTVTWKNFDGTELEKDENVPFGTVPTYDGETPVKAKTAQYSYSFAGWDPTVAAVEGDVTYTAQFTEVTNTYTVLWVNDDGTELEKDENVAYGVTPEYNGETPTKAATAEFTYTFDSWTPAVSTVTGTITYTAVYTAVRNVYNITFVNEDGTVLDTQPVPYGDTPVYAGATPTKAATAEFTYTFDQWTPEIVAVTGEATYTATFTAEKNSYTVQFVNEDGTVLDTQTLRYGETPVYGGETPVKEATDEFTYTFSGWTPEIAAVTGDTTYTAAFSAEKNSYTVKFVDADGNVLDEQTVAYGEVPVFGGETPAKAETARWNYAFSGWTPEITAVTGDTTYTAKFDATGKNGLCVEGGDTYWIENGENVPFPGLIRIVLDDGTVNYYYFGEDGKAVKDGTYKVEKNNGERLPAYNYNFDANGVIEHDEDTSKNGICEGDGSMFYYIDGVKVGDGLLFINGSYYYARTSTAEIIRNRSYYVAKTNGLPIAPGEYRFDTDGKMMLNGFVEQEGKTYYYDNGTRLYGFQKVGEDYYFFNAANGSLYKSVRLWVGDNSFGVPAGYYDFGADGKMVTRNGFFTEGNATYGYSTYYYQNGEKLCGFQKIGEDYYFFNAKSGKMYKDAKMWVGANDYGFEPGYYDFDADGKMIVPASKNGFVEENGATYYYVDGELAKGLTKIGYDYYFFNKSSGKLYKSTTLWVGPNDYGIEGGMYAFDADGRMVP